MIEETKQTNKMDEDDDEYEDDYDSTSDEDYSDDADEEAFVELNEKLLSRVAKIKLQFYKYYTYLISMDNNLKDCPELMELKELILKKEL